MKKTDFILLFVAMLMLFAAYLISEKVPPAPIDANTSEPQANTDAAAISNSDNQSKPKTERTAKYVTISAAEAKEMMSGDYVLLDVRTAAEFNSGHIPGAILIPDNEIAARAENELPDKDALTLIYCRSGRRSALAAKELAKQGYTNIYDFGGIVNWPYEIVK